MPLRAGRSFQPRSPVEINGLPLAMRQSTIAMGTARMKGCTTRHLLSWRLPFATGKRACQRPAGYVPRGRSSHSDVREALEGKKAPLAFQEEPVVAGTGADWGAEFRLRPLGGEGGRRCHPNESWR